ncbi:uncharacterized protein LOC136087921 [Hydra vulgaris]|uniref:Uncharacterized protein LOC136087921 n=1 Tax=Hydra vulgaris TaxID=6087 RepID=A0ABM4D087_HYDVU
MDGLNIQVLSLNMPQNYKPNRGKRKYVTYTLEQLDNTYPNKYGGQQIFTSKEEDMFKTYAIKSSEFEKKGVVIPQFKNNFPGGDWIRSFLKRNPELTVRFASNIKRKRAEIGTTVIDNYFTNLSNEISNISPDNIRNYDETNLSDDPGKKKILTKRGCKYPERIINSTKTSFSVMFCGNANGELLPPYVVYKAESLWNTWMEHGPPKARYNRSKSGWFDSTCFEDWFFSLLLPRLKKAQGRSVIIGDNVSSHLSIAVLDACQSNNIGFVALPANSTHLTQPLDVVYFRPMKINWCKILCEWKEEGKGRRVASLPKDEFPRLLITNLNEHGNDNLRAGFRKTGIFPLDKSQVLSQLPCCNVGLDSTTDLVSQSFLDHLYTPISIINTIETNNIDFAGPSTNTGTTETSNLIFAGVSLVVESHTESLDHSALGKKNFQNIDKTKNVYKKEKLLNLVENCYVIVKCNGELNPGQLKELRKNGAEITIMKKNGLNWKWSLPAVELFFPV